MVVELVKTIQERILDQNFPCTPEWAVEWWWNNYELYQWGMRHTIHTVWISYPSYHLSLMWTPLSIIVKIHWLPTLPTTIIKILSPTEIMGQNLEG